MVWVDRQGREEPFIEEPGDYLDVRISPDSTKVAVDMLSSSTSDRTIWIYEVGGGRRTRLAADGGVHSVWTPDGTRVAFEIFSGPGLLLIPADGSGEAEPLLASEQGSERPDSWSPDGQLLAFSHSSGSNPGRDGLDAIKVVIDRRIVPDARLSDDVLAAIIDEAHMLGLPVVVHAATVDDMLNAVDYGADRFVHTPHTGGAIADTPGARLLRDAGIPISTTVSFSSAEWAKARGQEWPADQQARHAQILENIRHLSNVEIVIKGGDVVVDNRR